VQTDADGIYDPSFINPLVDFVSITPSKGGDDSVGVSTLDLIKIQKHLLGIASFDSPYKYIAADANNTESVSAADLLELRKLILRINHAHPNNESWRFVPKSFVFSDPNDPWPFDESIIGTDSINNDFIAMKIGDLNGTVTAAQFRTDEDDAFRQPLLSDKPMVFEINNQRVFNGETFEIEFTSNNFRDIIGFQFTLEMAGLELFDINPGKINITSDNFAVHKKAITCSWFDLHAPAAEKSELLFTLVARAHADGRLREMLNINSRLTAAESYVRSGGTEFVSDLQLNIRDKSVLNYESSLLADEAYSFYQNEGQSPQQNKGLTLYQNEPNPFESETNIPFNITESGKVSLWVFSAVGREMYFSSREFPAGRNAFLVNFSDLAQPGLMYYRMESGGHSVTRRMIAIE
jgi:hypothetical protein